MKVVVKSNEINLNLPIPNFLIFNKIVFSMFVGKYLSLPKENQQNMYTALKTLCKNHKGFTIVEVETQDKEYVKITL